MSIDLYFRAMELEMEAARVRRESREAEEKAKADAIAAAAKLQRKVEHLMAREAVQQEHIKTLTGTVDALRTQARKAPQRRVVRVAAPAYCHLNAALENDTYE